MIILRILCAIIVSQLATLLGLWLWSSIPLWIAMISTDKVGFDATVIAIQLATKNIMLTAELICIPISFIACLAKNNTKMQRFKAMLAGFATALIFISIWQSILSFISGESIAMRYSSENAVVLTDYIGIGFILVASILIVIRFLLLKRKI